MKMLIIILINYWFWLALGMSLFWGIRSVVLFRRQDPWLWKSYEFIFNFIGSFAGWFCFYALLIRAQNNMPAFQNLTIGDIILFIISLLGLTGHLPQTTYGFIESFTEVGKKAIEKLLK